MNEKVILFEAQENDVGIRLDKVLPALYPDNSRQYFQKFFKSKNVFVNGKSVKSSTKLRLGDKVKLNIPPDKELDLKPVKMDLDIVYEDDNLIVLNKPAGLVVHPGVSGSHTEDSLVNALLHHCNGRLSSINGVLRPGIVHRLDKDTSGLLVVAKNDKAHKSLAGQFQERKVDKVYYALLAGKLEPVKGTIESPIGRDFRDRKKMAVVSERRGKMAVSKYEVIDYFSDYTYVKVHLITGRTHQIRVHFASIGVPIVGDVLYGKSKINKIISDEYGLTRQFLHAGKMAFVLPGEDSDETKKVEFESALPDDLQRILNQLTKLTPTL